MKTGNEDRRVRLQVHQCDGLTFRTREILGEELVVSVYLREPVRVHDLARLLNDLCRTRTNRCGPVGYRLLGRTDRKR